MVTTGLALLPALPLLRRRSRRHFRAAAGLGVLAYLAVAPFLFFYSYFLLPPVVLLGLCAAEPASSRPKSLLKAFAIVLALTLAVIACSAVYLLLPAQLVD